jgi:hypothetical protein
MSSGIIRGGEAEVTTRGVGGADPDLRTRSRRPGSVVVGVAYVIQLSILVPWTPPLGDVEPCQGLLVLRKPPAAAAMSLKA